MTEATPAASDIHARMAAMRAAKKPASANPKPPNKKRARKPFDGRFALGRRALALVAMFSERLGPDASDPITATAIRRAAETVALSEHLRAQMLRGDPVSPDEVLRASRAADMMTRRLHLDRHKPQQTATLSDYLTSRNGSTQP